jgi:hypothetical protein
MATSNVPFSYAVRVNNTVHLYILIYAGSPPGFPQVGKPADLVIEFNIGGTITPGNTKRFAYYAFERGAFTDIEINFNGHKRKILIEHIETATSWTPSGTQVFAAPYCYTQVDGANAFKAELVIFAPTGAPEKYVCQHLGPVNSVGDTFSKITINNSASATLEFTDSHTFTVNSVLTTDGSHEITLGDPPKQKNKTKNKNHSQTPFPRRRRRVKP